MFHWSVNVKNRGFNWHDLVIMCLIICLSVTTMWQSVPSFNPSETTIHIFLKWMGSEMRGKVIVDDINAFLCNLP